MVKYNPYLSSIYRKIWIKQFDDTQSVEAFDFISGPHFIKHRFLPLYYNVGKTLTKGVDYNLNPSNNSDYKKKALLVYDVPTYFEEKPIQTNTSLKRFISRQYPGFLIEVNKFRDLNEYLLASFSKNSRNKLKKNRKRLELSFDIEYKMFIGEMSKTEYDFIFDVFRGLLEKRFADKQITNNNLNKEEWDFYYEVTYPLILERKASLHVIYDGQKPIGVTLCNLSDDTLFDAITVFDIDYSRFQLGSTILLSLLEWCMANNIKTLDFSKGYFKYKTRWSNKVYDLEYHIYYDGSSVRSRLIAFYLKQFFDFKNKLREKKVNEKLHKLTHRLKHKRNTKVSKLNYSYESVIDDSEIEIDKVNVDLSHSKNHSIKLMVYDYVYLKEELLKDIAVFQIKNEINSYFISAKKENTIATIKD